MNLFLTLKLWGLEHSFYRLCSQYSHPGSPTGAAFGSWFGSIGGKRFSRRGQQSFSECLLSVNAFRLLYLMPQPCGHANGWFSQSFRYRKVQQVVASSVQQAVNLDISHFSPRERRILTEIGIVASIGKGTVPRSRMKNKESVKNRFQF